MGTRKIEVFCSLFVFFVLTNYAQGVSFPRGIRLSESVAGDLKQEKSLPEFSAAECKQLRSYFLWHTRFFAIGLELHEPWWPPSYPFVPHFFSLWELATRRGKGITIAFLDTPLVDTQNVNQQSLFYANHGAYNASLIAHNDKKFLFGLAPHARILSFPIFDTYGIASKESIVRGLQMAVDQKADIVALCFKIDEPINAQDPRIVQLEHCAQKIPYLVAAAGNDARWSKDSVAYPARLSSVAFDVGAFCYHDKHASICSFSQYAPGQGPKIVAPGDYVLGCCSVATPQKNVYTFQGGTSVATTLIAAFLALVLSEFGSEFSRSQLLTVCYMATLRLHDAPEWHDKVLLGALDFRFALFMLHVLRDFKKIAPDLYGKNAGDERLFAHLVYILRNNLLIPLSGYAQRATIPHNFVQEAVDYILAAQQKKEAWMRYRKNYFLPTTLSEAINYVAQQLKETLSKQTDYHKNLLVEHIINFLL